MRTSTYQLRSLFPGRARSGVGLGLFLRVPGHTARLFAFECVDHQRGWREGRGREVSNHPAVPSVVPPMSAKHTGIFLVHGLQLLPGSREECAHIRRLRRGACFAPATRARSASATTEEGAVDKRHKPRSATDATRRGLNDRERRS